jgi:hypothetical protein
MPRSRCVRIPPEAQTQMLGGLRCARSGCAVEAARRTLGDAPTRAVTERAKRRGVAEAEARAVVGPTHEPSLSGAPPAAPRWAMMAPYGASSVPRRRRRRRAVIVASRKAPAGNRCG